MEIIWIEEATSTNSVLKEQAEKYGPQTMLCACTQTSGRGQRGNSWEAEPGKNLTASILIKPETITPAQQFLISEATALALKDALASFGIIANVKWPNDIYVGNKKICGILIENSLQGAQITQSIIGIGLNVNQTVFKSDAPNPISMAQISGKSFDLHEVIRAVARHFEANIANPHEYIHENYLKCLWRHDGLEHPFRDVASGQRFKASIETVLTTGHLILKITADDDFHFLKYSFKEVEFLNIFD